MLITSIVSTENELLQIHHLNQRNLKQNLNDEIRKKEGFVTWLYPIELLKKMHQLSPSIIIKDAEKVVAYALTTLKEAQKFHPDLDNMFRNLAKVHYKNMLLSFYNFYCMGQICVDHRYRSMGLVHMLYQKHKEVFSKQYDFILTEISANNIRSLRAHEKIGFRKIHNYKDSLDQWVVVVWDWS